MLSRMSKRRMDHVPLYGGVFELLEQADFSFLQTNALLISRLGYIIAH